MSSTGRLARARSLGNTCAGVASHGTNFIDWLSRDLPPSPHLRLGVGDDAAVLRWARGGDMVVTTDAVTDEVDFRAGEVDAARWGTRRWG